MSNMFQSLTQKFPRQWHVPVVAAAILCLIASIVAGIQDYHSSYEGYLLLPTRKVDLWAVGWIAIVPQAGQVLFAYLYASNTSYTWAKIAYWGLHIWDVSTDVLFKALGLAWFVYPIAIAESEIVYCLGSEVLMTLSLGVIIELLPSAIGQITKLVRSTFQAFQAPDPNNQSQQQRP